MDRWIGFLTLALLGGCARGASVLESDARADAVGVPLAGTVVYQAVVQQSGPWARMPYGYEVVAVAYCEPYDLLLSGGCELPSPDGPRRYELAASFGDPTWPISDTPASGRSTWTCRMRTYGGPGAATDYLRASAQCLAAAK